MLASTSDTFSIDSSDSSEDMSEGSLPFIQKMDTDSLSISDFEEGSANVSVDMQPTILKSDTDRLGNIGFDNYGGNEQCKLSVPELASKRLYDMAVERSKRLRALRESVSDSINKPTIQKRYTDSVGNAGFEQYGKYKKYKPSAIEVASKSLYDMAVERRKCLRTLRESASDSINKPTTQRRDTPSVPELASKRLYDMAVERSKRLRALRKSVSGLSKKRDNTISTLFDSMRRVGIVGSVKSTSKLDSSVKCVKKGRHTKGEKLNKDHDNIKQGKKTISEIAGSRLHSKAIERNKRLALLRKEWYTIRPKIPLETVSGSRGLGYDSNGFNHFQLLYDLSKRLQEDGKKRRTVIAKASAKRNKVWIHPTDKISITAATRLYYVGMNQLIALERKRIEVSEEAEYKSRFAPFLQQKLNLYPRA